MYFDKCLFISLFVSFCFPIMLFSENLAPNSTINSTNATQDSAQTALDSSQVTQHKALTPIISSAHPISIFNESTIDSTFLRDTQARDMREIFAKDVEISVGGSAKIAQKLYIRGFEDRMFRIKLDGIAQNGNIFHHQGNVLLEPFLIKQITLQKGLADVESGAGALAGGISITSKNAFDMLDANKTFGAQLLLGAQSNYSANAAMAFYGKVNENLGLLMALSGENMPYFRDGSGNKVISSTSYGYNALFKLNYAKNAHSLEFSYHFNALNATAPYSANVLLSSNPVLFDNKLLSNATSALYRYNPSTNFALELNTFFSHKSLQMQPKETISAESDEEGAMDLALFSFGQDMIFRHKFANSSLKYGLNYELRHTKAYDLDSHQRAHGNLGYEFGSVYGGFVGYDSSLMENLGLEFGTRYDVYIYSDKFASKHYTQGLSPYIALTFSPHSDISFKLAHNYNTRGAMPLDASLLKNSHLYIHALKPESMQNTELNMDYDSGIFSVSASVYMQNLKNFINSYASANGAHSHEGEAHDHEDMYRQNTQGAISVLGYEGNIGLDFDIFEVHLGVAQSFPRYKGKALSDTFELSALSARSYFGSLGLNPTPSLQILYLAKFVESIRAQAYNLYYNELDVITKSAYHTHNIYINYDVNKAIRLSLALLNITNATYASHTSAQKELFAKGAGVALLEPGFSLKAQIGILF